MFSAIVSNFGIHTDKRTSRPETDFCSLIASLNMKQVAVLIALVALLALCSAPVAAKTQETESAEGFVCDGDRKSVV